MTQRDPVGPDDPTAPHPSPEPVSPHHAPDTATQAGPNEAERRRVQRRTLRAVVVSQVLGGAGLAAGISVGALLAQQMLGTDALSGLPTAVYTLGSAVAAYLVGRYTQRLGRRIGLAAGFVAGGLGAVGVVVAAVTSNVPLFFGALLVYGSGTATNLQARYAGTDLALPERRGSAISVAMVSTTLGAVAGPNLIDPLGSLAAALGIPALAGPFLLAAVAYTLAGTMLFVLLRPDPLLLAKSWEPKEPAGGPAVAVPKPGPGAFAGAAVMVLTQIAMVAIMTMTPVHMRAHELPLGAVGLVIGLHIGAMYLPSPVTGYLVDKIGRIPLAIASGFTLLASGIVAAAAPGDSLGLIILALMLLGLGWNFGLIAGTALVVDATVPENRARTQGSIDVLIALAGAGGGAVSGVMMSATSFAGLSLASGFLALLLIPALLRTRRVTTPAHQ